ncbi:MAG: hypothetical protein GX879_07195, partial [Bacteroidales bacterium]|nr:hypothetical protein [Bacteroidales bacterium]
MKRLIVSSLVFVLILCSGLVFAQIGHGGEPLSFQKANVLSNKVEHIQLAKPDMAIIEAEDAMFQKNGELYKVGRMLDVNVDINTAGTWDFLDDGTKVWRLGISAQDAKALAVYYDKFHLTPGSRLFLYNQNRKQVIGSFDHRNNSRFGDKFSTQIIEGETTWLELIIDANASEMPVLEIAKVSYLYRGVE